MDTSNVIRIPQRWIRAALAAFALIAAGLSCMGGGDSNTPIDDSAAPRETNTPEVIATPTLGTSTRSADNMTMLYVPEGEFIMGDDFSERELPAHKVYLDAYWIDQTEVTNAMYATCVAAESCSAPRESKSLTQKKYYSEPQFDKFPVVYITWDMAAEYCEWAGARLPTEAEWEKAARGTDARQWPWEPASDAVYQTGDSGLSQECWDYGCNNPIRDGATSCQLANWGNCTEDTTEVGSYENGKSPYGLYDMAGNVTEWVADWYDIHYYVESPPKNPRGPTSGEERVLRGGAFNNLEFNVRAGVRAGIVPIAADFYIGFRCASDETPQFIFIKTTVTFVEVTVVQHNLLHKQKSQAYPPPAPRNYHHLINGSVNIFALAFNFRYASSVIYIG